MALWPGDSRTEVEKLEDPVHGVLDIGGVVFQAKDEELFFTENGEPVQEIHGIEPDLQPHLGPEKGRRYPRSNPHPPAPCSTFPKVSWHVLVNQPQRVIDPSR